MSAVPNPRSPKRLGAALAVLSTLAVVGAACAPASNPPNIPLSLTGQLITQVVDQVNDAGRGASLAIDKNGDPVVSYVLATQVLKPGDLPPAIVPGQPQPPAVILATRTKGIWHRTSVTEQQTSPKAEGQAPELVDQKGFALPGVTTGLALDAQGKHHVVWSTPTGVFYSDDAAGGGFTSPVTVTKSPAQGASIAVGPDGSPWVAYYDGDALKVAHQSGGSWTVETVDGATGMGGRTAVRTAAGVTSGGAIVFAYAKQESVWLARGDGTGRFAKSLLSGAGPFGISVAIGKNDTAYVASYDRGGAVALTETSGGRTQVGSTAPGPNGPSAGWSTGVAVDDQGRAFVAFADTAKGEVMLSSNAASGGTAQPLPDSQAGANPTVAVTPDGKTLAVGWYDTFNANMDVATSPLGGLTLAFQTPPLAQPSITAAPSGATCKPTGSTINVVAQGIAFDQKCYAAPAGKAFTIDFDNKDPGTPHNFEVYTSSAATSRLAGASGPTDIIAGPATTTYQSKPLQPGTYYFQCDVHPTQMNGTFVVAKGG